MVICVVSKLWGTKHKIARYWKFGVQKNYKILHLKHFWWNYAKKIGAKCFFMEKNYIPQQNLPSWIKKRPILWRGLIFWMPSKFRIENLFQWFKGHSWSLLDKNSPKHSNVQETLRKLKIWSIKFLVSGVKMWAQKKLHFWSIGFKVQCSP